MEDETLQLINMLGYLAHDLGYTLTIQQPFNTLRWFADVREKGELRMSASGPQLTSTVKTLYDDLVADCKDTLTVNLAAHPVRIG